MKRRADRVINRVLDLMFGPAPVQLDGWAAWLRGLEHGHTQGRL